MEMIDIIDSEGNKNGIIMPKNEVHSAGLWHQTIHVWFINSKNEVLLQCRAESKINYPNMWDISVAGHVSSGESPDQAALREINEEIGVDLNYSEIKLIGIIKNKRVLNKGTYLNNEFNYVYLIKKDLNLNELILQSVEVKDIKWLAISEFKKWVAEKRRDLVPHYEECEMLFKII